eukprot:scaffold2285_cov126-Isochrysis_galbana.AAC.4
MDHSESSSSVSLFIHIALGQGARVRPRALGCGCQLPAAIYPIYGSEDSMLIRRPPPGTWAARGWQMEHSARRQAPSLSKSPTLPP